MIISYNTKGANNAYGYLANSICFDESRVIEKSAILTKAIDFEVDRDKNGGIIVFSIDSNVRFSLKYIYAWTVGKYLHGRYKAKNGVTFDENSISVELLNVDEETIIKFAEEVCRVFKQETVLVKLYADNRILFVNGD